MTTLGDSAQKVVAEIHRLTQVKVLANKKCKHHDDKVVVS